MAPRSAHWDLLRMKRTAFSLAATLLIASIGFLLWQPPQEAANSETNPDTGSLDAAVSPAVAPPLLVTGASDPLPARVPDARTVSNGRGDLTVSVRSASAAVPGILVLATADITGDAWQEEQLAVSDAQGFAQFRLPSGIWTCRTIAGGLSDAHVTPDHRAQVELEIGPTFAARGIVVDAQDRPIEGAEILIAPAQGERFFAARQSGSDGTFALIASAGTRIAVRCDGFAPSAAQWVQAGTSEPSALRFRLERGAARCLGTVVDPAGQPVAGARLLFGADADPARAEASAPPQLCTTDSAGSFQGPLLAPGKHLLRGTAPGFGPMQQTITLAPDAVPELRIELHPGAMVRGMVQDAVGKPIANALVYAGLPLRAFGSRWTHTDAAGAFTLVDLPAGTVPCGAYLPPDQTARADLELQSGATVEWHPTLRRRETAPVSGRVVDARGEGAAGWLVLAVDPIASLRSSAVATNDDGSFAITAFARGTHLRVSAFRSDQGTRGFPAVTVDGAEAGGAPIELHLDADANARGTVRGRVVTPDGRGTQASIELVHETTRQSGSYLSAPDGTFLLDRIPAGRILLRVRHEQYASMVQGGLRLLPGASLDLGELRMATGHAVFGAITNQDGSTPWNASIRVLQADGREAGIATIANGTYRTMALAPGRYLLQVQADGMAPACLPIAIQDADVAQDLVLRGGQLTRVAVLAAEDGAPARWSSLLLRDAEQRPLWNAGLPLSDRRSDYSLWLEPGTYRLFAVDDQGHQAEGVVRCEPGLQAEVVRMQLHRKE